MVVLAPDTLLSTGRDGGGQIFQPGKHTPARILEEDSGWMRVQIGDNLGCYFDPAGLAGLQLQLWTPSSGLSPVITETARLEYTDGTSLVLRAGIALIPAGEPGRYILVDQLATPELAVPPELVGVRYREDFQWYAPADRGLHTSEIVGRATLNGVVLPILPTDDPWIWAAPGPTDETATFSSFCAQYTATVPESAWKNDLEGGVMFGMSAPRARSGFVLEPGSPMWWPDDVPAGQTRCPEVFSVEVDASPAGRRCFVRDPVSGWRDNLSSSDPGLLTLCFDEPARAD
ncbi:MAG: hypothetical protein ACI8S6_000823 [Myxococcota bacterium]|jgi:hypothetical protein